MSGACLKVNDLLDKLQQQDPELADYLYEKVRSECPATWRVGPMNPNGQLGPNSNSNGGENSNVFDVFDDGHSGPLALGDWQIAGVDPRIQIYKYGPGGIFGKHRDGPTYYTGSHRSFFTVLVYLSDGYEGGCTTVFSNDLTLSFSIPPSLGSSFVMLQSTLHEGSKVIQGFKFALRCDVLYKRVVSVEGGELKVEEELMKDLEKKEQARQWFKLGSAIELSGRSIQSLVYYRKAYKLDPNLEEV